MFLFKIALCSYFMDTVYSQIFLKCLSFFLIFPCPLHFFCFLALISVFHLIFLDFFLWTIFKVFMEFVRVLLLFCILFVGLEACGILAP